MNEPVNWIIGFGAITALIIIAAIADRNQTRNDTKKMLIQQSIREKRFLAIRDAKSLQDLLDVLTGAPIDDFSDSESMAFVCAMDRIGSTRDDWAEILGAVEDETGYLKKIAHERVMPALK